MPQYKMYRRTKRRRTKKNKKNILILVSAFLFLSLVGFISGDRISSTKSYKIKADTMATTKIKAGKYMDNKKTKVQAANIKGTDTSEFNPYKPDGRKVVYLTFDDGPSPNNTPQILKILKDYNIKATFFLIGKNAEKNKDIVKEEVAEGHTVANHTYSHDMNYIYSDPKVFINDVNKCNDILKSILGNNYNSKLIRFPGGSFGKKLEPFREEAKENGYSYVDWNDLTGDAEYNRVPVDKLVSTVERYSNQEHLVVLMHDASTKATTVQALPEVIEYFRSKGYIFETLK
ncbi:polysaccharide deacetylase family protein [Clostridium sp. WILCCON 0269]|uniref:Polysaccharide deacetylase family protein n=1 Tax=Candidatus Clostridium eludens TaxID=3381663 RepID=A0ABW8SHD6_9CLOT